MVNNCVNLHNFSLREFTQFSSLSIREFISFWTAISRAAHPPCKLISQLEPILSSSFLALFLHCRNNSGFILLTPSHSIQFFSTLLYFQLPHN